ncbi:hypothetical protein K505DRAFT_363592 [Melanomma pulvis-pyrius CBS 109.77]|uniref:Lipocalin-like domain-containing protein n=1 Tax=Melanomma pulvis-pyrius CBS 109.77 TaxID=1314802 RepID=A0A6A6X693_9PLEO|nr:hypothetical protein K505DRAFT_363592 [Melanomma pulvis-pyrius CBS 109.77]
MISTPGVLAALVGTWQIFNSTTNNVNGTANPGDGFTQAGILNYGANGFMSANLQSTNPAKRPRGLTWPSKDNQTDADWAPVGKYSITYSGPYHIADLRSETEGQVKHGPMIVAGIESWMGTTVTRNFTLLEEGTLLLIKIIGKDGSLGLSYWDKLG